MEAGKKERPMSIPESISRLVGRWSGSNRLWLAPGEPVRESGTTLDVALTGLGQFATFQYTWAWEGKTQEGLLLVGGDPTSGAAQAAWVDSFHTQGTIMTFRGKVMEGGGMQVEGSYPAPPGPDWGWRIEILPQEAAEKFRLVMYNIPPGSEPLLAVEAQYTRLG
jgi:hypothetical protein